MAQHIVVTEYNPLWTNMFETEAMEIKRILGENCVKIYHVGSTAVVGLAAKPVIDIMPVVHSLEDVDKVSSEFEKIDYEYMGEFGIPGRRYLRKGGDERTHQIHIFTENNICDIERHLAVRDYLRTHKDICDKYADLKKNLAKRYPYDIDGYCDGKDEFVQQMEREALRWKKGEYEISGKEKFEALKEAAIKENEARYGAEIRTKYGASCVESSHQKIKGMSEEEWEQFQA